MKIVFVVDDMETNLFVMKKAIEKVYKTYTFTSAEIMFKNIERITPDLILLDIEMPEMDGFEAIQKIKQDERFNKIPVLFITGTINEEKEKKGYQLGALGFIKKPITTDDLLQKINEYI